MSDELTTGDEVIVPPTYQELFRIKQMQLRGCPKNVVIVEMHSAVNGSWVTRLDRWTHTSGTVYQGDADMMVMYPQVDYNAMKSLGMVEELTSPRWQKAAA